MAREARFGAIETTSRPARLGASLLALNLALAAPDARAAPPTPGVSPLAFGARCDGATDDARAIAAAIASARASRLPVLLPAANCAYGSVLNLDGVKLLGRGDASVLWALDPRQAAIFLRGEGAEVRRLRLSGVTPRQRAAPWEGVRIVAYGARRFVVDDVTIDGSTATGIQTARGATDGLISNNRIRNTLADGIHVTGRASYITIVGNVVENTGDDGIAVVSYQGDRGYTHHVTVARNTVSRNRGGRGLAVVGGADVLVEHNRVTDSGRYACLYLAQEDAWKTLPLRNVVARSNTLVNCGSFVTGHAAVMLFADTLANEGVQIVRNDIAQQGQRGIRAFGLNSDVAIEGNRIRGAREALQLPVGIAAAPYAGGSVGAE